MHSLLIVLRDSRRDLCLNATVIGATQDLKVTIVAPVRVPGIRNQPVGRVVLHSPSQNTNRMSSEHLSRNMLIHSRLVIDQILVDREGTLHRSIVHDLVLDLGHILAQRVRRLAELAIIIVADLVAVLALLVALGRLSLGSITRGTRSIYMVFTGSDFIRTTALAGSVGPTTDQSLAIPVRPGGTREASVASESTGVATGDKIISRETEVLGLIGVNAVTIGHGLHCSECPTRATRALVTDLSDTGTARPLLTRVKVLGDLSGVEVGHLWLRGQPETMRIPVHAHQTAQVIQGSVRVEVGTSLEERGKRRK